MVVRVEAPLEHELINDDLWPGDLSKWCDTGGENH